MLALTYSLADQHPEKTKSIGILNVSLSLAAGLCQRADVQAMTLLTNRHLEDRLRFVGAAKARQQRADWAVAGRLRRMAWDQWGVYRAAQRTGHEWLILPKGFASFCRPCPVKLGVYMHDAIHDYYQSHYSPNPMGWERWYFQRSFLASIKQAKVIFTNTEFTAAEVARIAGRQGLPLPRLQPVGVGFSRPPDFCSEKQNRVMMLVSRWPHKRSDLALDYLERWQRKTRYAGYVDFVGAMTIPVERMNFPRWQWHRRLPEGEYRERLAQAQAVVFFSDYEGFGMPPVEAILGGACPVYSDIPATREVMRGLGCAFQNGSYDSFARALGTALAIPAATVGEWAEQLLRWHDWNRVVDKVAAALLPGASSEK